MSLAVLYRRRKDGRSDDESTLSMMESLFAPIGVGVVVDVDLVATDEDLEDASHEEVADDACDGGDVDG
jgi:hypothetical protein